MKDVRLVAGTKTRWMPPPLRKPMDRFLNGRGPYPKGYAAYHRRLAVAELVALGERYGVRVAAVAAVPSPWLPQTGLLSATIVTRSGMERRVVWHERTMRFLREWDGGWRAGLTWRDLE